ncbi:MAG TPA: lipoyl(octanoyl) transferase LipB [Alphaproteobacteria bacterium]|nr:lipoyl(octanoyl) transferase LipB [Alphaproteobacteria bacterium]
MAAEMGVVVSIKSVRGLQVEKIDARSMGMDWIVSQGLIEYPAAVTEMERRVAAIRTGEEDEAIWLLEHPPLYTAGTSAKAEDLVDARFPVFESGRGGQYTYHGPGQRVAYVMLDLKKRQNEPDIKKFVWQLEEWIIRTLAEFDIKGERREGRVGIWVVVENGREDKIAAIGVRVRHWVTYHGISINVSPDLSHFGGIVPCGIKEHGVTSFMNLNKKISTQQLDTALKNNFDTVFC